jgi:hypothetical protein
VPGFFAAVASVFRHRPDRSRPVYHQGETCPVCRRPVGDIVYGPGVVGPGGITILGGPGTEATLMPCQHRVRRVLAPGRERRRR